MKNQTNRRSKEIHGWHFTSDRLRNGEPIPPVGKWLRHEGKIEPCVSGLHASEHPFDSLQFAPGNNLHKVILRGDLKSHGDPIDKWVGRERKILASIDAEPLLREFARQQALKVIHLWNAPKVVKQYLETGNESLRDVARVAAWAAAPDAARNAARVAARAAAWVAARATAWAAAWDAAWNAARVATRAAAWDAAWDAAWVAAWDAAWVAFITQSRKDFNVLVEEAFN